MSCCWWLIWPIQNDAKKLIVLSESYSMNTNMTGFGWFSSLCVLVLWMKVASALEGLTLMMLVAIIWPIQNNAKKTKKLKPWQMGTHQRVLSESCPMNTNMTGLRWFSKICILVLRTKVASALEGLTHSLLEGNLV